MIQKGKMKITNYDTEDIIATLKAYRQEESEESFEPALYFVSYLVGMSPDAILEAMDKIKK